MIEGLIILMIILLVPAGIWGLALTRDSSQSHHYTAGGLLGLTGGVALLFMAINLPDTPDYEKLISKDVIPVIATKQKDGKTHFLMQYHGKTYRLEADIPESK